VTNDYLLETERLRAHLAETETDRKRLPARERQPVERDGRGDLRGHLEAMCKLWPEDISDDGSGRMGFKPEVIEVVTKARAALERKP
jgi:hypothetical protein